jgi:hypothetical protein
MLRTGPYSIAVILFLLAVGACSGAERQARNMLLEANSMIQRGDTVELIEHLNGLIEEYPDTEAAVTAGEMLAEAIRGCNDQAENKLLEAFANATIFFIDQPNGTLDRDRLIATGYRDVPEVIVEIPNGQAYRFRMTAHHVAGDLLYAIDIDGNLTSQSIEERK